MKETSISRAPAQGKRLVCCEFFQRLDEIVHFRGVAVLLHILQQTPGQLGEEGGGRGGEGEGEGEEGGGRGEKERGEGGGRGERGEGEEGGGRGEKERGEGGGRGERGEGEGGGRVRGRVCWAETVLPSVAHCLVPNVMSVSTSVHEVAHLS